MLRRRARLAGMVATLAVLATTGMTTTALVGPAAAVPPAAVKQRTVGQTATFSHLTVKVLSTSRRADSYFFGAKISACVKSLPAGTTRMRLS